MTREEHQGLVAMATDASGFILGRVHQESETNESDVYRAGNGTMRGREQYGVESLAHVVCRPSSPS